MLARSETSRMSLGFQMRPGEAVGFRPSAFGSELTADSRSLTAASFAKYSACTFDMMNDDERFWPKRKCQMHQLIIVRPRRLRCSTHSAAVSSGMFTHRL